MTKIQIENILTKHNLRKTNPRKVLGWLILQNHPTHWTAESLYEHSKTNGYSFSLATVYNTLNQFADKGIVKRIYIQGTLCYFDTNLDEHHHVYHTVSKILEDIPLDSISVDPNLSLTISNRPMPKHEIIVYAHD